MYYLLYEFLIYHLLYNYYILNINFQKFWIIFWIIQWHEKQKRRNVKINFSVVWGEARFVCIYH